jgi:hypothetical protein
MKVYTIAYWQNASDTHPGVLVFTNKMMALEEANTIIECYEPYKVILRESPMKNGREVFGGKLKQLHPLPTKRVQG